MHVHGQMMEMTMFLHDWNENHIEGVKKDFDISDADLLGVRILLASYTYEDYSGSAFVLFVRDGKLFEVNGGHCSCYGLEDQWSPEETSVEELRHRLKEGQLGADSYYGGNFADQLSQILDDYALK